MVRLAGGWVSYSTKYAVSAMTPPAATAKPNTLRQPNMSVSKPPMNGETIGPKVPNMVR